MNGTLRLRHEQISKHCFYWTVFSTVIWSSKTFTIKAKLHLFMPIVVSTTVYASNTWKSTSKCIQQLDVLQQRCLGISWISSSKIELQTKMFFVYLEWFHEVNWWLIGMRHTMRLPSTRPATRMDPRWCKTMNRTTKENLAFNCKRRYSRTWNQLVSSPQKSRKPQKIVETLLSIAILRLEDPGNQVYVEKLISTFSYFFAILVCQ